MNIYLCEKNIIGFLTAVFYAYYNHECVDKVSSCEDSVLLGDTCRVIEGNEALAKRVRAGIIKKAGEESYERVYLAYAVNTVDKEDRIYRYLKLLFKHGKTAEGMYSEPDVMRFEDLTRRVGIEAHRLKGFVRFQEMANGTFYGYYGSDHDVLEFIAPHFADRFNSQSFILHDLKRRKAVAGNGGRLTYFDVLGDVVIELSEKEELVSMLWRQYQKNVNIESRKNKRLQDAFMPARYRWFMNV